MLRSLSPLEGFFLMQGPIFQVLALVTHGNAALSGRPVAGFYPSHAAFAFTEHVRFAGLEPPREAWKTTPFAADPGLWLAKLRDGGCRGLRAWRSASADEDTVSDRFSIAFVGGGGRWLIESVGPAGSDFWMASWKLGNRDHPDRKIWQVTYGRVEQDRPTAAPEPASLDRLSRDLQETLRDAIALSRRNELEEFTPSFEAALDALAAEREPDLHGLAPPGQLPLPASRLAAASLHAWVFGGMGSWNDIVLRGSDDEEYHRISENLYRLINAAAVEAVNCSYGAARRS
jgi:hypothetical protein